ncbi:MAG: hypothetical protein ACJAYA_001076 [Bacteroidia bacterium]|jgi:hypothetical protein
MIAEENRVINSLWIGTELSILEQLTLRSFVYHGHKFCLWIYDDLTTEIPEGICIMDANEIIPKTEIFSYKNSNQFGHGKGSVAGFSDIFRYKLLYEKGGWWVDMDVTCLKPFNKTRPYYFRAHHELEMVGNVMKCPRHSPLMLKCYVLANSQVTEQNQDWHLPIQILNNQIQLLNLSQYIVSGDSPTDQWHVVAKWIFTTKKIPESFVFIHWLNEVWRAKNLSKNDFFLDSVLGRLLVFHDLKTANVSWARKAIDYILFYIKMKNNLWF